VIVFLIVLVLSLHIFVLFNGRLFPEFRADLAENEIEKQIVGVDRYEIDEELGIKAIMYLLLFAIPVMLLHVFLISVGLMNDPYLYPSLGMLTFIIISIIFQAKRNKEKKRQDLTIESNANEYREKLTKQHSLKNKLVLLVYITYFIYLLWVFVG